MTKFYSQKNPRYRWQKLGRCRQNIGQVGCFVTSLANLADTQLPHPKTGKMVEAHPGIVDWTATLKRLYSNGCMVNSPLFAELLDLEYNGKSKHQPDYDCIAETDYYRNVGFRQHFFIVLKNGDIIDPLDGTISNGWQAKPKPNKYKYRMVSYRLFRNTTQKCTPEEIKKIKDKIKKYKTKLNHYEDKLKDCA